MLIRGNRIRTGFMLWLLLVMSLLTMSAIPTTQSLSSLVNPQNESAALASFAGSSTIFNTSTLGSIADICIGPSGYLYLAGSSMEFPPIPPTESSTFIISIHVSSMNTLALILPQLVAGSIGITILIIALVLHRRRKH